jgi:hypothetical protein
MKNTNLTLVTFSLSVQGQTTEKRISKKTEETLQKPRKKKPNGLD